MTEQQPLVSAMILRWLYGVLAGLLVYKTAQFAGYFLGEGAPPFVDINAFYIVGQMAWSGTVDQAYYAKLFVEQQRQVGPPDVFMPWTYPPPFNVVCAALAAMPLPVAYALFAGTTLLLYVCVLKRIAGEDLPFVLAAMFPVLFITLACGQNGFLTGSLIGLASLWLLKGEPRAGVPLGLMVIKPHLAAPIGLYVLLRRDWRAVAVAAATVLAACVLSTFALGLAVWPALLNAMAEAKIFIEQALYPLYRMVSSYAFVRSIGAPPLAALAAQIAVAAGLVAMLVCAWRRGDDERRILGLAAMAGPFISPYAYDYDLGLYGVGLALLMPDVKRLMSEKEQLVLLALSIGGGAMSIVQQHRIEAIQELDRSAPVDLVSFGGVILLAAVAHIWRVVSRERAQRSAAALA